MFFATSEQADYREFLDELPGPYLVVLGDDGTIIACGGYAVSEGSRRADLCWGMVRREDQRRGIGRLLLEERLRRIAAEPSVGSVRLDTSQHTRAYYEKAGFRVDRVVPDGYAPGYDRYDMTLAPRAVAG
jgi:ribosomal protein S18 acetylase RimI-like enzyme